MTEENRLLQRITDSPENVHSAMQIIAAKEAIQMNLLDKLKSEIEVEAKSLGWSLVLWDMRYWERYSGLSIEIDLESEYQFCLEFQNAQMNNLVYGLLKKIPRLDSDKDEDVFTKMNQEISLGRTSKNWVWYKSVSPDDGTLPIERDWASIASPWVSIQKHEMSKLLIEAATKLSPYCVPS